MRLALSSMPLLALSIGAPAHAGSEQDAPILAIQETQAAASAGLRPGSIRDEIVVTGTNIHGIAPDSSPSLTFNRDDIDDSGFLTTEQFLRSVPQIFSGGVNSASSRGRPGDIEGALNPANASGANLRGLGAGATLTLLNGRRMAPAGASSSVTDISAIPLAAVERIVTLTDGASSIYGADAVSGVINFILREDFNGAESRLQYGGVTEGNLNRLRASQTIGGSWGSGNALVSYEFFDQDALLASEKSFASTALPFETLLPEQRRHSLMAAFSQSISDNVKLRANGFFADRDNFSANNRSGVLNVNDANTQQLLFSSSLEFKLPAEWHIIVGADYSNTDVTANGERRFLSSNQPPVPRISQTQNSQVSADFIADGPLFDLPGGSVKLAIGAAYRHEDISRESGRSSPIEGDREIWAGFSELFVPIVGADNRVPGIERLEINASVRNDHYSDFGNTTNPKVGLVWSPLAGLNFRGTYSTSFKPPSLRTALNTQTNTTADFARNPANPSVRDIPYLLISSGSVPDLDAESSRAFTAGLDYDFNIGRGYMSLSSTYYNIDFDNRITLAFRPRGFRNFDQSAIFLDEFPTEIVINDPTLDEIQSAIDFSISSGGDSLIADGLELSNIEFILDQRTRNQLLIKTRGVDFNANYNIKTTLGDFNASLNGNYILDITTQPFASAPPRRTLNRVQSPVDFRMRGGFGWSNAGWRVSSFVNFTDGYNDTFAGPGVLVDSWTTLDLNVAYTFGQSTRVSVLNNVRMALSVLNVADQDPPEVSNDADFLGFTPASYDSANANPLGRFISFAISKQW